MNDSYLYIIIALLPLAACMVVFQVNPYHALVIRGILGAVAAMVYAVLGAPDVALTEALVGTMLAITLYAVAVRSSLVLAITLYAVAVRSSLVMRLGLVKDEADEEQHFGQLMDDLRTIFRKRQMRLELVPYPNTQALERALMDKEVHATCVRREQDQATSEDEKQFYHTAIRVKRIYEIMQTELTSPATILSYVSTPDEGEKHK